MTKIVAHEFGHAMGLSHDVPGTVMCEDVNCAANKVTCGDVAQFWRVRGGPAAFAHACGVAPTNP
jgi:hypothetical protein